MSLPSITIITPVYNREKYLPKLIDSLEKQTYKNFIWLVGNDGSNDNTDKIIREFAQKKKIKINYFFSNIRVGKSKMDNILMENINTDLVTWCDSDDYFLPDALENLVELSSNIQNNDKHNYVGVYAQNLDTNGKTQTFYEPKLIPIKKHIIYEEISKFVKGDGTLLAFAKDFKNKKFLEVDFLISESSLLRELFQNKKFLLSSKVVKIMDRNADNSLSFSKKLMYCRGSAYCISQIENKVEFDRKNIFNKIKTIINYWRYCFHGDISLINAKKKWIITRNNHLSFLLLPISYFYILKDIISNKVVKTHKEFQINIKKAKISSESFF